MIDFSKRVSNKTKAKRIDPIEIYDSLDRSSATGPLRPAQIRVLETWFSDKRNEKDLIIKLHTGAGKTLIGLLIAQSYLNSGKGPAIYICPNIYLMQQACEEAEKFGIPHCYIPKTNEIPDEFLQGQAVLITYVQKVFNGLSIFGIKNRSIRVGCLVLDDSHACIDSITGASTIRVLSTSPAFKALCQLFESDLKQQGEGTYQDFLNGSRDIVIPIPYWTWQNNISQITEILSKQTEDTDIKFAWPLLRDQLSDCHAFLSNNKIEIVPACVPIQQFGIFSSANHRILMSATTQEDTFFVKGLGLSIHAVEEPLIDNKYQWSGEKMVLIPELICESLSSNDLLQLICSNPHKFGIAVLAPSFEKAKKYESLGAILMNEPGTQYQMYNKISEFKENYIDKTIVFANRYDGIDLPDDLCRILILDSVPYYDSLSDRYEELCRPESEIVKIKTIQKIEQGLGRSVRGEKDYSVILLFGRDLIKYLRTINNRKLFSPQTQKQIEIGFDIIEMAKEDAPQNSADEVVALMSTINQCLERDSGWKDYYADRMDEISHVPTVRKSLYDILQKEREAYTHALIGNYDDACAVIQNIVDMCEDDSDKAWYLQMMAKYKYHTSKSDANTLQISAFKKNNQLLKPISGIVYSKIRFAIDDTRARNIQTFMSQFAEYSELSLEIEEMLSNLSFGVVAEKFENAICNLGKLLGYISQRPDKEIRKGPDNLWCISSNQYVLIECKSEVLQSRKAISKDEAGQMEEHCAWFEEEYPSANARNILIIPTAKMATDAYFSHDVRILKKKGLEQLKKAIRAFVTEFKQYSLSDITAETINSLLVAHQMHKDSFIEKYLEEASQ